MDRRLVMALAYVIVVAGLLRVMPSSWGVLAVLGILLFVGVGFVPVLLLGWPGWVVALVGAVLETIAWVPPPSGPPPGASCGEGVCGSLPGVEFVVFAAVAVVGGLAAATATALVRVARRR